jgi:hypothetical protein
MSAEALPFTLLIIAVELAVGSLWVLWAAHLRGTSADSFIKFCVWMVVAMAVVAFVVAAAISVGDEQTATRWTPIMCPPPAPRCSLCCSCHCLTQS